MKDPEFIELRNRLLMGIGICIVLLIPFFLFFYFKIGMPKSKILNSIEKEESFVLLVTENRCKKCKEIKKELKELLVEYKVCNKDTDRNYSDIIKKLDLEGDSLTPPTLIIIKEGIVISSIEDIEKEDVKTFIENNEEGE